MEALNTSQENEEGTANSASPAETPASPSRRLKRSASRELSSSSEKRRELSSSAGSRSLRKQSSSPGLTQDKGGDAAASSAQEPWKREVNDLWAKQLAMMREINTLKVELGRREAARQREILAMRQEVDVIKGLCYLFFAHETPNLLILFLQPRFSVCAQ